MTDPKRPSNPRLTPLVPPRPKPPANRALEEYQAVRRASQPDVDELGAKVDGDFKGLAKYMTLRETHDRVQDHGLMVLARAIGCEEDMPAELRASLPPRAIESVAKQQSLFPRIERGVARARQEIQVTQTEKILTLAGNFAVASLLILAMALEKLTFEQLIVALGLVALPGAGSVAAHVIRDRAAKREEP